MGDPQPELILRLPSPPSRILLAAAFLVTTLPAIGSAQAATADTLPFRPGQWAVQFWMFTSQGVGVLRFRSPSSAWLLDGSLQVEEMYSSLSHRTLASVSIRAGLRSYRPLAPQVVRYVGGGVTGVYQTYRNELRTIDTEYGSWMAGGGGYAEIGAEYRITSYLGVGASSAASLLLRGGRSDPGAAEDETSEFGWTLSAGSIRVLATIYF